jgi:hypothetical protein
VEPRFGPTYPLLFDHSSLLSATPQAVVAARLGGRLKATAPPRWRALKIGAIAAQALDVTL